MASTGDDEPDRVAGTGDRRGLVVGRAPLARGVALRERVVDRATIVGERAGRILVYSSVYIAFVAMAEVAIAMVLLSIPPNPAPLIVGLVTFAVYANDRIADADTDVVASPGKVAFVRRHRGRLSVLAALAYGIAVSLSVLGGPLTVGITLLPGLFWVLYATDWIPRVGVQVRRLKEVFLLNTAVVALAWATTVTLLPLTFVGRSPGPAVAAVFAYFFLRSFVDTEIPNVRDVEGDVAIGVSTLPVVLGVERTRLALYAVDAATAVLVVGAAAAGHLAPSLALCLLVGLGYSVGVVSRLGRLEDVPTLVIASELEYLVVGIALAPLVYGP